MFRQLRSEFSGRIATVTLARPERRNAFSAELMREMIQCAHALAARADVDLVIVSGAGAVFSAGADLKDSSRWAGAAPLLEQREIAGLGASSRATPSCRCPSSRWEFRSPGERCRAWSTCSAPRGPSGSPRMASQVLEKPRHSVLMTKETVNAYAAIGAHAVSHMAHDQLELAAGSPESRAAREAALRRKAE
jgi:hypothetical protein